MESYELNWHGFDFEDGLKTGFKAGYFLYAIFAYPKGMVGRIVSKPDLIYVGQAIKQTVSERLMNKHKALKSALTDFGYRKIGLALGFCEESLSVDIVNDIEKLIIFIFKPNLNGQGLKDLRINRMMRVTSSVNFDQFDVLNFDKKIHQK